MQRPRRATLIFGAIVAMTFVSMPVLGVASVLIPVVTIPLVAAVVFGLGWWRGAWSPTRGAAAVWAALRFRCC
jgi:hypothetical protein